MNLQNNIFRCFFTKFILQKYLIQLSKYAKKKVKFNNVINLYSYSYNFLSTKKFFSAFKQFFFTIEPH